METLPELKTRLREQYLGLAGIHGIGISRSQNAIRLYVSKNPDPSIDSLLEAVRVAAQPYAVILVHETPPSLKQT